MKKNTVIDILKMAIIMERRGKAFYEKVAEQATSSEVQNIFKIMANEEDLHIAILSKQYINFGKNKTFKKSEFKSTESKKKIAKLILSKDVKKQISAAGYEAAAISSAIDMENNAIKVYSGRVKESTDPIEKELFQWLADWENGHLKILSEMNKELMEDVWYDNKFWPF
jgi:rubrerythrin